MEREIEMERSKLNYFKQLIEDAIKEYSHNRPYLVTPVEMTALLKLIDRVFIAEIEYLHDEPECYFDLYDDGQQEDVDSNNPF